MKYLILLLKYILHYITSDTRYSIHPPFAYKLITEILPDKSFRQENSVPENIRTDMLNSQRVIKVDDLGAGAGNRQEKIKKLSDIAAKSLTSPRYAGLLFKFARYFKPGIIIELGTSLGVTSAYFSRAIPEGKVITIEGCKEIADIARLNHEKHHITNVKIINSNFDDSLPLILKELNRAEFVFFDGNHRKEATLKYFELCLQYIDNNSIFIFDDINWSEGMKEAWHEIKRNKQVTLTLDFFRMGVVFFRKELSKQNFKIRL